MELNTLNRTLLFDVYGDMLTEKQRCCFDYRYNQDLSLSEIGEIEGISRQAVHDNLLRTDALLLEMEEKIGAVALMRKQSAVIEILDAAIQSASASETDTDSVVRLIHQAIQQLKE